MFARVTNYHAHVSKLHELEDRVLDLCPRLKAIPGIIDVYTAWRDDGQAIAVAFYLDEGAADAASLEVQSIWAGLSDLLTAPIQVITYDTAMHLTFDN